MLTIFCISTLQTQSAEQHIHKRLWDAHQHQCKEAKQSEQWGKMTSHAKRHKQQHETKYFGLDLSQGVLLTGWRMSQCLCSERNDITIGFVMTAFTQKIDSHSGHCAGLDDLKIALNLLMVYKYYSHLVCFTTMHKTKGNLGSVNLQTQSDLTLSIWHIHHCRVTKVACPHLMGRRERKGVRGDGSSEEWRSAAQVISVPVTETRDTPLLWAHIMLLGAKIIHEEKQPHILSSPFHCHLFLSVCACLRLQLQAMLLCLY